MKGWRSVVFVATRDLLSEKLITACLVLSVMAVLAPIMLLASVKIGFIDRLRSEFIADPSFREVRPREAALRQPEFFDELRRWEGVVFAMPSVMLVPREVFLIVQKPSTLQSVEARLLPSDARDPLNVRLEGIAPAGDGVVLTSDVAAEAGLGIGDPLSIAVDRVESNRRVRVQIAVTVTGILPDEMLPRPTILVDPVIDREVEDYRAGISVPARGWAGISAEPRLNFASLAVLTAEPLGEILSSDLRIRLGTAAPAEIDAERLGAIVEAPGASLGAWKHAYLLTRPGGFGTTELQEAAGVLGNVSMKLAGLNAPLAARLPELGLELRVASADPAIHEAVAGADWQTRGKPSFSLNDSVFLPKAAFAAWRAAGSPRQIALDFALPEGWATRSLSLPVSVAGEAPGEAVLASPLMAAMVWRGAGLPLVFDPASRSLSEQSAGYRGFRLVADTFETVPALVERLTALGIPVQARSDEILKLQKLERSLDILVATVAVVGLGGGIAILAASFFANVQRKQVSFATIRLIGMPKTSVFGIPIVQAVVIACLGYVLSCVLYFAFSSLLNGVIAAELGFDGQLSKLYPSHIVMVAVFVVLGTCAASLWASREATRIDPAQALRAAA